MASIDAGNFRLAVLNPGGRDPEQHFDNSDTADDEHAPVNFHAFAACTRGAVFRDVRHAIDSGWPALVLLRGDLRASERAVRESKRAGRTVAIALKETGAHQIAQQLRNPVRFARFADIVAHADGCVATTPEAAELFRAIGKEAVIFIPTPYPVELPEWNCSVEHQSGIFIGTREFDVPSRNHLVALLAAKHLSDTTGESVTVYNLDGWKGRQLIAEIGFSKICVHEKRIRYRAYLNEVARHKIVFQLDRSRVPGQVAGDATLCRTVCVGGDGAIERIAFPETCGEQRSDGELSQIGLRLLQNEDERRVVAERATEIARERLSFRAGREALAQFFAEL